MKLVQFNKDQISRYRSCMWGGIYADTLISGNWTAVTEHLMAMLVNFAETGNEYNLSMVTKNLEDWFDGNVIEDKSFVLPPEKKHQPSAAISLSIKDQNFATNPFDASRKAYNFQGSEVAYNDALPRVVICAAYDTWVHDTLVYTSLTNYDSRSLAASLIFVYILRAAMLDLPINWQELRTMCFSTIQTRQYGKTMNLQDFDRYWGTAINYKNYMENNNYTDDSFKEFLVRCKLDDSSVEENRKYPLLSMSIMITLVMDIHYRVNCVESALGSLIPLDMQYFRRRISEIATLHCDPNISAFVAGCILGTVIDVNESTVELTDIADYSELKNNIDNFIGCL
jgi:hypothetical protein